MLEDPKDRATKKRPTTRFFMWFSILSFALNLFYRRSTMSIATDEDVKNSFRNSRIENLDSIVGEPPMTVSDLHKCVAMAPDLSIYQEDEST